VRPTREDKKRLYRQIFDLLNENPWILISKISREIQINRSTASNRLKEAFEQWFIIAPKIRVCVYCQLQKSF